MVDYRLFLLDGDGVIQARQEMKAENDTAAITLSSLVWQACSDTYAGYELWSGVRCVVRATDGIGQIPPPLLDEFAEEMQARVLELEDRLQRSLQRVGASERLLASIRALRHRLAERRQHSH